MTNGIPGDRKIFRTQLRLSFSSGICVCPKPRANTGLGTEFAKCPQNSITSIAMETIEANIDSHSGRTRTWS